MRRLEDDRVDAVVAQRRAAVEIRDRPAVEAEHDIARKGQAIEARAEGSSGAVSRADGALPVTRPEKRAANASASIASLNARQALAL